jgi:hypothetical protein
MIDSFGCYSFSHSMNNYEPNMRFYLFDGFLYSFLCGLRQVHGHAFKASFVGPRPCSCDAFIVSSHVVPLRASHRFLIITLVLFLELIF